MEQLRSYFRESYDELINKVTWPTWQMLQETTVVVLVAIALLAAIIFLMDSVSGLIVNTIYNM